MEISGKYLYDYFFCAAKQYPNAIAILARGKSTTFEQLYQKSLQAAKCLAEHGLRPGHRIAILRDKDEDYFAWIIGALRQGIAYIPLDRDTPEARNLLILQKSQPELLIIGDGAIVFERTIQISNLDPVTPSSVPPAYASPPDALAYIIFTSGSTGQPKGVMIDHRGLANFCQWVQNYFYFIKQKTILNIASFSFDQSVLDLVLLSTLGCKVVCCEQPRNPISILQAISSHAVTAISTVPNTFSFLNESTKLLSRFNLASLETLILGGSPFHVSLRDTLFRLFPDIGIYNIYGPTEATVYCMVKKVIKNQPCESSLVQLGIPINNTDVVLLDNEGRVQIGPSEGELTIIGPQVMAGYFQDPEKTQQVMTSLNFSSQKKFYRTGDLVRRANDGEYYFIGRMDDQVKTGGYRVNLLEVEGLLLQHEYVIEAAVVPCPKIAKGTILVAYLSLAFDSALDVVVTWLEDKLPRYMIPQHFIICDQLPRNNSGKIDKATLKAKASLDFGDTQ